MGSGNCRIGVYVGGIRKCIVREVHDYVDVDVIGIVEYAMLKRGLITDVDPVKRARYETDETIQRSASPEQFGEIWAAHLTGRPSEFEVRIAWVEHNFGFSHVWRSEELDGNYDEFLKSVYAEICEFEKLSHMAFELTQGYHMSA